jgi:hypothetical protein
MHNKPAAWVSAQGTFFLVAETPLGWSFHDYMPECPVFKNGDEWHPLSCPPRIERESSMTDC